jgi:plasmid maintenance system killer protein
LTSRQIRPAFPCARIAKYGNFGLDLEALSGGLQGFWSIRIIPQWRIVFRWRDGDASDVKITDYH